jgi:hypothetical protein
MHSLIAMVLAMRSAPALRARMHELMHIADDRPFLLSRFQGTVWIEVGAGNRLRVLRKQVSGLPFVDIDQVLRAEPTLKDAIQASIGETGANSTAMRLLDPILDTQCSLLEPTWKSSGDGHHSLNMPPIKVAPTPWSGSTPGAP